MAKQIKKEAENNELLASDERGEWQSSAKVCKKVERYQAYAAAMLETSRQVDAALPLTDFEKVQPKASERVPTVSDTHPDMERLLLDLMRQAPAWRLAQMQGEMYATMKQFALERPPLTSPERQRAGASIPTGRSAVGRRPDRACVRAAAREPCPCRLSRSVSRCWSSKR